MSETGASTFLSQICQLEAQLARHLTCPRVASEELYAARHHAVLWSHAVWQAAQQLGAASIEAARLDPARVLARRPVFVCGTHRSGTTLVRDLLDGHTALTVLPSEGTYFSLERRLRALPASARLPAFAREWLSRLANPICQEPYWALGRSNEQGSPYVDFARSLLGFWPHLHAALRPASLWPLAAVALAYAECTLGGAALARIVRWVEKTPTNERHLEQLWREFPQAKVIHVVRHPLAVLASHRLTQQPLLTRARMRRQVLRDLDNSYRAAATYGAGSHRHRYALVHYEDLIERPAATLAELAAFLGIEWQASLLQPTVAGRAALSNSSFEVRCAPGQIASVLEHHEHALSQRECAQVLARLGSHAAQLGYTLNARA